jgi:hypothetical protein
VFRELAPETSLDLPLCCREYPPTPPFLSLYVFNFSRTAILHAAWMVVKPTYKARRAASAALRGNCAIPRKLSLRKIASPLKTQADSYQANSNGRQSRRLGCGHSERLSGC